MTPEALTDEKIVAFLDGELTPEEDADMALAIANSADVAARVEALALDMDELTAQFEDVLASAPDMTVAEIQADWSWLRVAAAALVLIGAGVVGGFGLSQWTRGAPDWHQAVADYQTLYTTETLAAVPQPSVVQAAGLRVVSQAVGMELTAASVAIPGLTFQRAQILRHKGQALGQLAYLDRSGNPIAFCIMSGRSGEEGAEVQELAGLNAVTWQTGGHGFIIIGPVAPDALTQAQEVLAARL
ncbi:MAG: hypothetical protein AAF666_10670 [Pseudomonadota bacterium]